MNLIEDIKSVTIIANTAIIEICDCRDIQPFTWVVINLGERFKLYVFRIPEIEYIRIHLVIYSLTRSKPHAIKQIHCPVSVIIPLNKTMGFTKASYQLGEFDEIRAPVLFLEFSDDG
ncbi:hypothetical protein SDC9_196914 [bioreactor metagenome]|uniref:Uncharacterized protein n=1 Tax=bioreactor metagenome TaxID=1076179 RepID=A0A645IDH2_9ZZZZ